MRQLFFDHNATTPLPAAVQQAMLPYLAEQFGDPSSSHALGRAAREALEDAREHLSALLGCDPDELVFTSGGTESNNLALKGLAFQRGGPLGGHLVISAIEHPSVAEPARFLERLGYDLTIVPVASSGRLKPAAVRQALREDTLLVSVLLACPETGAIQPIKQIAEVCHAAGVLLHTDASQGLGKMRVNVDELEVDLLTLSGHKMYAPKGIGALYVRQGITLEPLLHGAGQEASLRAGTENVAAIAGLGAASVLALKGLDEAVGRMESLQTLLLAELRTGVGESLLVHAERSPRLPNTLSCSFPNVLGQELLARVPELSAATSAAHDSDTAVISPTLAALDVTGDVARGTIRLSLGWQTTEDDVRRAASALLGAWESLCR